LENDLFEASSLGNSHPRSQVRTARIDITLIKYITFTWFS